MPMHDWTRVDAGIYHHFHGRWLYAIAAALNEGVLPTGYYALADQVVQPFGPDVIALQTGPPLTGPTGGTLVSVQPPAAEQVVKARVVKRKRAHRRIAVRHVSGHRVVAVLELLSPGNKSGERDFKQLVYKAADLVEGRVNVLIVDPFPPTARNPQGVHAAVWKELTRKSYTPPPDKPLTAVSYAPDADFLAFIDPFAVGLPVPTLPLFLNADEYVNVPLEATYQAAFKEVPAPWRITLEAA